MANKRLDQSMPSGGGVSRSPQRARSTGELGDFSRFDIPAIERLAQLIYKQATVTCGDIFRRLFKETIQPDQAFLEIEEAEKVDSETLWTGILSHEVNPSFVDSLRVSNATLIHEELNKELRKIYNNASKFVEAFIDKKEHSKDPPPSLETRLLELEQFATRYSGIGVADYARILFPELAEGRTQPAGSAGPAPPLPTSPPATWKADKQRGETPPSFVKRVYGEWLGKGFTRATLRHLDPPLAQAMTNWLRNNEMPGDVDLPTLQEQNTRWVERMERDGIWAVLPDGPPEFALREGRRLATAKHRRSQK